MPDFDRLAGTAFKRVTNLYGEVATWLTSKPTPTTGKVLFKNPTEPVPIGGGENYEYRPNTATVEFYRDTFTGLKKAVDNGKTEYIKVREQKYLVQEVTTKSDGNTYIAHLEPEL